jgi:ribonuclease J
MNSFSGKKPVTRAEPKAASGPSGFVFVPLGGTGEIGMNFNLYGCDGAWLAVDCGMGFAGPEAPEAELLLADPAYIVARRENLRGLVITHAHEDHIGGVARLWPQLQCPVYATPFTAAIFRNCAIFAAIYQNDAFHAGSAGAGDYHPVRHGPAYRRLQVRPAPDCRRADR